MSLVVEKGTLTAPAGTGNQTYNLGSAFDGILPKAVILWATYETAAGITNGDGILSFGMGTFHGGAVQHWNVFGFDDDATAAVVNVNSFGNTRILGCVTSDTTTLDYSAALVSLNSGTPSNFVLNWTDAPASQILVHYLVLGGTDITAAYAGNYTTTTAVATQDVTITAGFGQPDLILFGNTFNTGANVNQTDIGFGFGAAKSDSERRAGYYGMNDTSTTMQCASWMKARAMLILSGTLTADGEVDLSTTAGWPTDGFEISYPDQAATAVRVGYLALKGTFTATISSTTIPTSGAPNAQSLALASGTPKCGIFWGNQIPVNAAIDTTHADLGGFCLGATDGTNDGFGMVVNDDANTDSRASRAFSSTKAFARHLADAAGGAATLDAEADGSISGSNVVLTWNDVAALAAEYNYLLLGEPAAAGATSLIWQPAPSSAYSR